MPRELKHFLIALPVIVLSALAITLWIGAGQPKPTRSAPADPESDGPRIAVLSPALAVIVRDLGLEADIVARHGFDIVLDKSIPVAGDQSGLDYEALLLAKPTHVLIQWGQREFPRRLGDLADERGWIVEDFDLLTLSDISETTAAIEQLFDIDADRRLSDILPDAWAASEVDLSGVGRVLMLAATQPPRALGPGSYHHQILVSLGAEPAITDGASWKELDAEDVLRLAPDAIILIQAATFGAETTEPNWDDLLAQLGRVGDLDIPAIRGRRVVLIDDPLALIPSTATADLSAQIRSILERWAE